MTWIPVAERLPRDLQKVLVWAGGLQTEIWDFHWERVRMFLAVFRQGRGPNPEPPWRSFDQWGNNHDRNYGWETNNLSLYGRDVTHWMPLPDKPEGWPEEKHPHEWVKEGK